MKHLSTAMIFLGLFLLGVFAFGQKAHPQDREFGTFGSGHDENHDQYKSWQNRQGGGCCDGRDCRPIRSRPTDDGNWQIWVPELRTWLDVPQNALLPADKLKDGRSHACTSKPGNPMMPVPIIYCFTPAEPKS